VRLTERLGQLHDLGLQLLLPRRRPDRPATKAVFPASKNSAFQRPIDCSETFSFRAASAIDIPPAKIANTIRVFFSGGIAGGRLIASPPDQTPIMPSQPACQKV
jgi:hypothetical protein